MKKNQLNASTLKYSMLAILVSTTLFSIVLFYFVRIGFHKLALEISSSTSNSNMINVSPQQVKILQDKILSLQPIINKTSKISIQGAYYQDQAIKDINKYANDSGVIINGGFSFSRPENSGVNSQLSVGNIKTEPVVITIANPVQLSNFVKFLRLIETNLPKMQVSGINIRRAEGSNSEITTEPLLIEVYTRQ